MHDGERLLISHPPCCADKVGVLAKVKGCNLHAHSQLITAACAMVCAGYGHGPGCRSAAKNAAHVNILLTNLNFAFCEIKTVVVVLT